MSWKGKYECFGRYYEDPGEEGERCQAMSKCNAGEGPLGWVRGRAIYDTQRLVLKHLSPLDGRRKPVRRLSKISMASNI
jgi:hypothetical protein